MNALLIVDKPAGLTSHDVVNRIRRILGERSVGHLGTLDPLATGVLPLVVGNLTRLAQFYTASEKTYEGSIRFGFATDTYDAAGKPCGPEQPVTLSLEQVKEWSSDFQGIIEQVPPPFSAKKIQGVPAYKLARKKKEVVLKSVQVEIKKFQILSLERNQAHFLACVSSGTYMRSIAHEIGRRAVCGAHLQSLRRTISGEFDISDAHTLEEFDAAVRAQRVEELLIHPRRILPQFPCVTANEEMAARIRTGRTVNLPDLSRAPQVKVFAGQSDLIAIATRVAGTLFHPRIVFAAAQPAHVLP